MFKRNAEDTGKPQLTSNQDVHLLIMSDSDTLGIFLSHLLLTVISHGMFYHLLKSQAQNG